MIRGNSCRLLFVGFGDIERSLGARAYLLGLLEAWRCGGGAVHGFFLQQAVGNGSRRNVCGALAIFRPILSSVGAAFPTLLWRAYEVAWGLCRGYGLLRAGRDPATVCLLAGAGLLPLTRVFRGRYARLVYVLHGVAEEFLLGGPVEWLKYKMTKALERTFLPVCDAVIVVSKRMSEYCQAEYGVNRTLVVPCGVRLAEFPMNEEDRFKTRRALNISDRFVFVYCGGAAPWQCVRETVECYRLAQTLIPNALLLILSPDGAPWAAALGEADPAAYQIVSVPHTEVSRFLWGADAAFLLRKRTSVNLVSAPVKFAEYLACGLPIVTSPFVGDYSAMVQDRALGVVIDPADQATWPAAIRAIRALAADPETRARCRRAAEELSWEAIAPRLHVALDVVGEPAEISTPALLR